MKNIYLDLFSLINSFKEKANFPADFNVEKTSLYRYITTSDAKSSSRHLRLYRCLKYHAS